MLDRPMRVLIVDDEPIARRGLRRLLGRRCDVEVIGECADGIDAVDAIRADPPDLVLLDVQMPGLDGLGVVRAIGVDLMPPVIFVTAHDQFAVPAFELDVMDYVVKPFADARLNEAIERALSRRARLALGHLESVPLSVTNRVSPSQHAEETRHGGLSVRYASRFLISVGRRSVVVDTNDIRWIRADDCYATLVTPQAQYLMRVPLHRLAQRLAPREFMRIHRSVIVRLTAIASIEHLPSSRIRVVLDDGVKLPVSRGQQTALLAALDDLQA